MKKAPLLILLSFFFAAAQAQITKKEIILKWDEQSYSAPSESVFARKFLRFDGAQYDGSEHGLPIFTKGFPVPGPGQLKFRISDKTFSNLTAEFEAEDKAYLNEELEVSWKIEKSRADYIGFVSIVPLIKVGAQIKKLDRFVLDVEYIPASVATPRSSFPTESALASGQIFKVSVQSEGIYELGFSFFQNSLGVNPADVDPNNVQLFSLGSGALEELNSATRYLDLEEHAIRFVGGGDGSFDQGDKIIFYAGGPHRWEFNNSSNTFNRQTNPYAFSQNLYIKINGDNGLRVSEIPNITDVEETSNSSLTFQRFEEDKFNILFQEDGAQGSGRQFFGDLFLSERSKQYSFNVPNIDADQEANIYAELAVRSGSISNANIEWNGETFQSNTIGSSIIGNPIQSFAKWGRINANKTVSNPEIQITLNYPSVGDGTNKAWIDFIELNAYRDLIHVNNFMRFQHPNSKNHASFGYELSGAENLEIWNITDPLKVKKQQTNFSSGTHNFGTSTDSAVLSFVSFNPQTTFSEPSFIGPVQNQNLHALDRADLVVLYDPLFQSEVQRFATHRSEYSDLVVEMIPVQQVYEEFGAGSKDPSSIRNFCRMLYERDPNFRYLLLFGDASFDARDIYGAGQNFVATYETEESFDPIRAFPADDYFGLLDPTEGASIGGGLLDLGIGRITCRNLAEAKAVVDKIVHYDNSTKALKDWRNRIVYVADDEDNNTHLNDSDELATETVNRFEEINNVKIYLDAFQQEATSGGTRFPLATDALNRNMFRGALVFNYFGHGGAQGWAQERVLDVQDIQSWDNLDAMPLLVTATCTFAGFDGPELTSGGELALLNPKGGPVALYSTTRAVYASQNSNLVDSVFDTLFTLPQQLNFSWTLGDIFRDGKNQSATGSNARKFALLGDPSLRLKVPQLNVITTSVNGTAVTSQSITNPIDTFEALQLVTITGQVLNEQGQLHANFNGRVYPTVFDKLKKISTLGQDSGSKIRTFDSQENVVFKGQASVTNGEFTFSFIVPKDIDYNVGPGKISYYAEDGSQVDARGVFKGIAIGGGANSELENDADPIVEIFLNDLDFVSGGITDENPTLIAQISDDYGINIAGSAIGHNLTGILDQNTAQSYILNDFYEAALDDYTKGEVRFPLYNLSAGLHEIEVMAWDVSNNSGKASVEFLVAESGQIALDHVLNYPNPFTTNTSFQFEHNMNDQELNVQVQIFSVSGKLVKTIKDNVVSEGNLIKGIEWDGLDDYGDQLAKGVYVYRIKVKNTLNPENQDYTESDYEKLVILK